MSAGKGSFSEMCNKRLPFSVPIFKKIPSHLAQRFSILKQLSSDAFHWLFALTHTCAELSVSASLRI